MRSAPQNNLRLFGLDLRTVWQDLRRPWQGMHHWPLFSWLAPASPVRLLRADGSESFWRMEDVPREMPASFKRTVRFSAVELPEDNVLRRSLRLPVISEAEIESAVALEARSISPFPPEDLVWGHRVTTASAGVIEVDVVLASRKQAQAQLHASFQGVQGDASPEVWVLSGATSPTVLSGFGEGARVAHAHKWRRIGYLLLLLAMGLVAAIAVTPTAQLRLRANEAVAAFSAAQTRAEPLLRQREALVKASDRLKELGDLVAERVDPLAVVELLTQSLPDDTSLLSLQVQGAKVTLSGQTSNAAALMQQLGTKPGLRDVKAPSPATKPLGAVKESFTIEFMLDPKVLAPVNAAQIPASSSAASAVPASAASAPVGAAPAVAPPPQAAGTMSAFTTGGRGTTPVPSPPGAAASKAASPSPARAAP